jgi:hypothetical protein
MRVRDKLTDLEKRLEKLSGRGNVERAPLEIRAAVLDEIESQIEPLGNGRFTFPYNHVRLRIVALEARRRAALEAMFGPQSGFRAAILERLRDARAQAPDDIDVSVTFSGKAPSGNSPAPFRIEYGRRKTIPPAAAAAVPPQAQLVVTKGTATRRTYACTEPRINIGRLEEVVDRDHHVVRRNQVAFADPQDDVNETVSRCHAHISFNAATGQFRLYDENSSYGTRIFRGGRSLDVPASRGALLHSGDELFFGRASVRFMVKA